MHCIDSRTYLYSGIFGGGLSILIWHATVTAFQIMSNGQNFINCGNLGVGTTLPNASIHAKAYGSNGIASIYQGASSQSANLTKWQDSSGTVLASVSENGVFSPASMPDSAAANHTLYYSTTTNKLVYNNGGGVVNTLN